VDTLGGVGGPVQMARGPLAAAPAGPSESSPAEMHTRPSEATALSVGPPCHAPRGVVVPGYPAPTLSTVPQVPSMMALQPMPQAAAGYASPHAALHTPTAAMMSPTSSLLGYAGYGSPGHMLPLSAGAVLNSQPPVNVAPPPPVMPTPLEAPGCGS